MRRSFASAALSAMLAASAARGQNLDLATVVAKPVARQIDLPSEIAPYLAVSLHAKVSGYVTKVLVDRGSVVKEGETLVELSAPEMKAQAAEAQSKVETAQSERLQAAAQLAAAQDNLDRLKKAAETPGAIAGNEIVQAQKQVDAAQALVTAREHATQAAQAGVKAVEELEQYLKISAPFEGVITERMIHPGALVGPPADPALLTLEQVSRLRIVVPVPEEDIAAVPAGARVPFTVPAHAGRTYAGVVARSAHALDAKTRTMPVELDADKRDGSLAPGMYPTVKWPVKTARSALWVPATAVVTTTERTFVIRARGGKAEWVDVRKGAADGPNVEVSGALTVGDQVVKRGTDEIRDGSALKR